MLQLDLYIGRTVMLSIISVLLLLLMLMGFFELVKELEEVTEDYTTQMAFLYVGMVLPRYSYDLFPVATLLGSLIGLGSLAAHSELTAFRVAGVSVTRILIAVLKSGLLLFLFVAWVGESLAPRAEQQAQQMKMEALTQQIALKTRYGFWSRHGNTYTNIRRIMPDLSLGDISIYEYDRERRLQRSIHAVRASHQGDQWLLKNVRETVFEEDRVYAGRHKEMNWDRLVDTQVVEVLSVPPKMLPAWDLWRYVEFLKQNGQASADYEVAFWSKLIAPVVTLVMLFLSVPFVFGSLRSVGIGERIFTGAVIGVLFHLLNRTFTYTAVVYGAPPLVAAAMPAFLFLALGYWLFRRVR
jgi:lipopolysaccharide export system permease protein